MIVLDAQWGPKEISMVIAAGATGTGICLIALAKFLNATKNGNGHTKKTVGHNGYQNGAAGDMSTSYWILEFQKIGEKVKEDITEIMLPRLDRVVAEQQATREKVIELIEVWTDLLRKQNG